MPAFSNSSLAVLKASNAAKNLSIFYLPKDTPFSPKTPPINNISPKQALTPCLGSYKI
jgi:hypothetical protein